MTLRERAGLAFLHRLDPEQAVRWILGQARQEQVGAYLDSCGWGGALEDWLRLGLLYAHFGAGQESAAMLKSLGVEVGNQPVAR